MCINEAASLFRKKKSALKLAKRSVTEGVYCRLLEEVLRQDKTKFPLCMCVPPILVVLHRSLFS